MGSRCELESGLCGEVIDGFPVCIGCVTESAGLFDGGEIGHSWGEEPVVDAGEEESSIQAMVGDCVTIRSRYLADEIACFESAQIVGDLSGRDVVRGQSSEFRGQSSEVLVGESVGVQPECQQS